MEGIRVYNRVYGAHPLLFANPEDRVSCVEAQIYFELS